ncbi:unnamed protein product [Trichogramma brassicae]|uniref:Uncharacterized protein n=1 Tax=Trichogramma brassicae TaxID=86971 RepID=A0A6H5I6Q8_9HYME|nr:unnamed protein product [Trichogramma brassicae]
MQTYRILCTEQCHRCRATPASVPIVEPRTLCSGCHRRRAGQTATSSRFATFVVAVETSCWIRRGSAGFDWQSSTRRTMSILAATKNKKPQERSSISSVYIQRTCRRNGIRCRVRYRACTFRRDNEIVNARASPCSPISPASICLNY